MDLGFPSQGEFCSQGVREGLIVGFIRSMCQTAQSFCDSPGEKGGATPPALLLLLSRLCLDYETATISYILTLTDEQFLVQVKWLRRGERALTLATQEVLFQKQIDGLHPSQPPFPKICSPLHWWWFLICL